MISLQTIISRRIGLSSGQTKAFGYFALAITLLFSFDAGAAAESDEKTAEQPVAFDGKASGSQYSWKKTALFLGGAATGFLAHESCHTLANFAFGNTPHLEPVKFLGFIPFFTISPDIYCKGDECIRRDGSKFGAGPMGLYTIVSAGLECQNFENELILTHEPGLRNVEAPFRKGILVFNIATSVGYSISNWLAIEPDAGDLKTLDRLSGIPRGVIATTNLLAAALDLARYYYPDVVWIPWVSRGTKAVFLGFTFSI